MIRNTYSNETVNLILDIAYQLFMEKGYESTCVQDIINHLKQSHQEESVYYYFKSKEDILVAITDRAEGFTRTAMAI